MATILNQPGAAACTPHHERGVHHNADYAHTAHTMRVAGSRGALPYSEQVSPQIASLTMYKGYRHRALQPELFEFHIALPAPMLGLYSPLFQ